MQAVESHVKLEKEQELRQEVVQVVEQMEMEVQAIEERAVRQKVVQVLGQRVVSVGVRVLEQGVVERNAAESSTAPLVEPGPSARPAA